MTNAMDYKLPPQNLEAEKSVLGSILLDKDALIKVADRLMADDFYETKNGVIYQAMLDLYEARQPIDILSLTNRLKDKNETERSGGTSYVASLAEVVPTSGHVVSYADIVANKSTLRRLIRAADKITGLGYQEQDEVEDVLDQAEQALFAISQKHLRQNFVAMKSILTDAFDRIDELHKQGGSISGISTGFRDIDKILSGLHPSDLVILAARPAVGKTSFVMNMAHNVAVHSKVPVGIFSLEMSKEQLVDRMIASESGIDMWKMRTGKLNTSPDGEDYPRLARAMATLYEAPIFIDDSGSLNIMELRTKARRLQTEHGLGLLIIDYLQLMEGRSHSGGSNADNRTQEIAEITRALKSIARELKIPVIALSQLSRVVEQRSPAIPRLADLRESGSIEQDADIVMFIYRKFMDKSQHCTDEEKNLAEIHISKHRNGPTGVVQLYFHSDRVSFADLAANQQDPFSGGY